MLCATLLYIETFFEQRIHLNYGVFLGIMALCRGLVGNKKTLPTLQYLPTALLFKCKPCRFVFLGKFNNRLKKNVMAHFLKSP